MCVCVCVCVCACVCDNSYSIHKGIVFKVAISFSYRIFSVNIDDALFSTIL